MYFKFVAGSIKTSIVDIFESIAPTPHLLFKKVTQPTDLQTVEEYCNLDFES